MSSDQQYQSGNSQGGRGSAQSRLNLSTLPTVPGITSAPDDMKTSQSSTYPSYAIHESTSLPGTNNSSTILTTTAPKSPGPAHYACLELQDVSIRNLAQNPEYLIGPDGQPIPLIRYHFAPFDPISQNTVNPQQQRRDLLVLIKQAESAERFQDMALMSRQLATVIQGRLSREERNLFYIAHQQVLGPLVNHIKVLNKQFANQLTNQLAIDYRKHIEYELKTFCKSLIEFVLAVLLPPSINAIADHQIFFLKFIGDCYRYIAELNPLGDLDACRLCRSYYHDAAVQAERYLSITSPIRLGLLLSYSVAAFELFRDYKAACEMIKGAFDRAITRLDELDEEDYRDSTLLLQLMRDNLALWVTMQQSAAYPATQFPSSFNISMLPSHPSNPGSAHQQQQQPTQLEPQQSQQQ